MTTLSTHVLDTAHGRPAAGMTVALLADGAVRAHGVTNADGRCPGLVDGALPAGHYALRFDVAGYFRACGMTLPEPPFLGEVTVAFGIGEDGHYHVPLLVSPYGYSTYRGS